MAPLEQISHQIAKALSTDQQILLDQLLATSGTADERLRAWNRKLRAWERGLSDRGATGA